MDKDNIVGTGLSGLVGSRIVELLSQKYNFHDLSRKTGTDITDRSSATDKISNSDSNIVLHMAAKTDVDGCEKDKDLKENGEAWKINVLGTENIIEACKSSEKKLIYISTDMVFKGDKSLGQTYSEEETPDPCNWYAQTKYEAEKRIISAGIPFIILRIAYPYRAVFEKKEYVRIFYSLLKDEKEFSAITDNYFTPTFIDDIAVVLQNLIEKNQSGIFHAGGLQTVSPFECANIIAQTFNLDKSLIKSTTREVYFKDRAYRPFNTSLKNARIESLGIQTRSFNEGIQEIRNQILKIKNT